MREETSGQRLSQREFWELEIPSQQLLKQAILVLWILQKV
jgi:hypothetical protein